MQVASNLSRLKAIVVLGLLFLSFVGAIILIIKSGIFEASRIEIVTDNPKASSLGKQIVVEIAGEVLKPGVYKLNLDSRIEDLLIASGGLGKNANRDWVEKNLNRATKLSDGQKIYIPNYQSSMMSDNKSQEGSSLININSATLVELDSLSGIGPVYAQNIIDHRPYSNIEELVSKNIVRQSTFDKIKSKLTI